MQSKLRIGFGEPTHRTEIPITYEPFKVDKSKFHCTPTSAGRRCILCSFACIHVKCIGPPLSYAWTETHGRLKWKQCYTQCNKMNYLMEISVISVKVFEWAMPKSIYGLLVLSVSCNLSVKCKFIVQFLIELQPSRMSTWLVWNLV